MNWSQTRSIFEKSTQALHDKDSTNEILSKESRREATKSVTLTQQDRVDLLKQKQKDMFHASRLNRLKTDQLVRNSKTRKASVLSKSNLGIIPHTHCQQTLASRVKVVPKPKVSPHLSSKGVAAGQNSLEYNQLDWRASKLNLPSTMSGETTSPENIQFIKNDRKQASSTLVKGVTNNTGAMNVTPSSVAHCRVPSHVVKKSVNRRPRNERISRQKKSPAKPEISTKETTPNRRAFNNDLNLFTQNSSLGEVSQTASSSHNSKKVTAPSIAQLINKSSEIGAQRSLSSLSRTSKILSNVRSITEGESQATF